MYYFLDAFPEQLNFMPVGKQFKREGGFIFHLKQTLLEIQIKNDVLLPNSEFLVGVWVT
jgi:hypothetical protein